MPPRVLNVADMSNNGLCLDERVSAGGDQPWDIAGIRIWWLLPGRPKVEFAHLADGSRPPLPVWAGRG